MGVQKPLMFGKGNGFVLMPAVSAAAGKKRTTFVPSPGALWISIRPLHLDDILDDGQSQPRMPSSWWVLKNGSHILSISSGGIPFPVSATEMETSPGPVQPWWKR